MFVTDVVFWKWSQLECWWIGDFFFQNLNVKFTTNNNNIISNFIDRDKTNFLASSFSLCLIREIGLLWLLFIVKCSLKCWIRISTIFITESKKESKDFFVSFFPFYPFQTVSTEWVVDYITTLIPTNNWRGTVLMSFTEEWF